MCQDPGKEIPDIIRYFGSRKKIFNVHFRNIRGHRDDFAEVAPDEGSVVTEPAICIRVHKACASVTVKQSPLRDLKLLVREERLILVLNDVVLHRQIGAADFAEIAECLMRKLATWPQQPVCGFEGTILFEHLVKPRRGLHVELALGLQDLVHIPDELLLQPFQVGHIGRSCHLS